MRRGVRVAWAPRLIASECEAPGTTAVPAAELFVQPEELEQARKEAKREGRLRLVTRFRTRMYAGHQRPAVLGPAPPPLRRDSSSASSADSPGSAGGLHPLPPQYPPQLPAALASLPGPTSPCGGSGGGGVSVPSFDSLPMRTRAVSCGCDGVPLAAAGDAPPRARPAPSARNPNGLSMSERVAALQWRPPGFATLVALPAPSARNPKGLSMSERVAAQQ